MISYFYLYYLVPFFSFAKVRGVVDIILSWWIIEFGREKQESLSGLSDKEIEDKVTSLVKNDL